MSGPARGVIYVATGAAHVGAARASARSVRRTNPALGITLFCDRTIDAPEFDRVAPIERPHVRSKVEYLARSPYAQTLYLDTDTRVAGDLGDLFRLLERFDLAAAHRRRQPARVLAASDREVPASCPEFNSGVVLYVDNPAVREFLAGWLDAYRSEGAAADQLSFRKALWRSDLRIAVLPARFNTRRYSWIDHWRRRGPPPAILHVNRFHPSKCGSGLRGFLRRHAGPVP